MPDRDRDALPLAVAVSLTESQTGNRRHADRLAHWLKTVTHRRERGETHPVWDFLFTYYSFRLNKLQTWVPGLFDHEARLRPTATTCGPDNLVWEAPELPDSVRRLATRVAQLCQTLLQRPPRWTCLGLHEWAMVYHQPPNELRHPTTPLRMEPLDLARFVESQVLVCSHYDAFRFFTNPARPRNTLQPASETRLQFEQPGCLHVNMDLYKWSYKLWPWVGSDLVGDCFLLAADARSLDMRASPYDLSNLGFQPVPIETPAGREAYQAEQRTLTTRATPLRRRLLKAACQLAGLNLPLASPEAA